MKSVNYITTNEFQKVFPRNGQLLSSQAPSQDRFVDGLFF